MGRSPDAVREVGAYGRGMLTTTRIRLHHEERGSGDAILCLHGTGSSALLWEPALPQLARLGRVISYDRRGCTRSERPDPYLTTSVAEHRDDAGALVDELGAAPAVLIGRSYGGEIALDLALRRPGHVRALVLLEATPLALDPEVDRWLHALSERTIAAGEHGPAAAAETLYRDVLGDAGWDGLPREVRELVIDNGPAILAELRGGLLAVDRRALATIDKPTLVVSASDSPPAFRRVNEELAAAIPNARTALVGGSHMIDPAGPDVLAFVAEMLR